MQAVARRIAFWVVVAVVALLFVKLAVGAVVGFLYTVAFVAVVAFALVWALRRV